MAELTMAIVRQWVNLVEGTFTFRDACYEIGVETASGKSNLRVYLKRLEDAAIIVNIGGGKYRKIDTEKKEMDWQNADSKNIVPLKWPFGIENHALIYPRNVAIVAGNKQSGKTTFLYEFIKMNMYDFEIELFNSETGAEQMKDRFLSMGIPLDAPFKVYERYDNFADVIDPDNISVIDYLDLNKDVFLVGEEIDRIFRKKRNGIAIIGMQIPPPTKTIVKGREKKVYRDYAYGSGATAKRAFIYLSMFDDYKIKLVHAKKPANPKIHPENMTWTFDIDENGEFDNIRRFMGDGWNL